MKFCSYTEPKHDCTICSKRENCVKHHEKHIKRKFDKQLQKAMNANYIGGTFHAEPK
jgi:hypothetical protein